MKKSGIKVGVIGYGGAFNMGRMHLNQMQAAGMTPCAVAEIDTARLDVAASHFPGIETYRSVGKMLKQSDVQLVTVITPHNTHARLTLQCLRAGRHVVVEKPMAITTVECDRMIKTARQQGVLVTAYHNRHWDGCIVNALKIVRRGAIGEVVRVEAHAGAWKAPGDWWRASKSISGGILYDWGVHFLEYTLQLMDADIAEVSGYAKTGFWKKRSVWKDDASEDEAFVTVRYADGRWSTLLMSSIDSAPRWGQLSVTGTKGTLSFSGKEWRLTRQTRKGPVSESGENPKSDWDKFYKNIADHLAGGKELVITPEWSRRPVHILDLACRSAACGRTLKTKHR